MNTYVVVCIFYVSETLFSGSIINNCMLVHIKLSLMQCCHIFSNSRDVGLHFAEITTSIIPPRWYRPTLLAHGLRVQ